MSDNHALPRRTECPSCCTCRRDDKDGRLAAERGRCAARISGVSKQRRTLTGKMMTLLSPKLVLTMPVYLHHVRTGSMDASARDPAERFVGLDVEDRDLDASARAATVRLAHLVGRLDAAPSVERRRPRTHAGSATAVASAAARQTTRPSMALANGGEVTRESQESAEGRHGGQLTRKSCEGARRSPKARRPQCDRLVESTSAS